MFDPRWPDAYDSTATGKLIRAAMKPFANFLGAPAAETKEPLPTSDEWTEPLRKMVSRLTSRVFQVAPNAERFLMISGPDAVHVNELLISRLRLAVREAGFDEWRYSPSSSIVAVRHLRFGSLPRDETIPHGRTKLKALFVTHTETALSLTEVHSDPALKPELTKRAVFVKPQVEHTKEQYVQNVRMALTQFLRSAKDGRDVLDLDYDEIILLGSQADQEELSEGVRAVFGEKINAADGRSRIRNMTVEDQLFAAARGAADLARFGLETAFVVCKPNDWCPKPEPLLPVETGIANEAQTGRDFVHAEL